MSLIKPDGFVGLLTKSGIYADKTAARFFKSVSTKGPRVRPVRFREPPPRNQDPAVLQGRGHAVRKVLRFHLRRRSSGASTETECAFFLHDTETINDPDRCFALAPDDFARVNPNTGTAPIFRTRRDADIAPAAIYERHPVLVDRSGDDERRAWPVRYVRMFDMTNDSHLFRTADAA